MDPQLEYAVDEIKKASTPRKVTKFVARLVIGHCAATVAKNIIKNVHPEPESKAEAAKLTLGSYAIGGAVAMRARRVVDHDIDDLFDIIASAKHNLKKKPTETPTETIIPPSE